MTIGDTERKIALLSQYITERRKQLMDKVLNQRTRELAIVLEDIYQSQNASAVLRSMDCFGVQDVHVIEKRNEYKVNPMVTHGASKWISVLKYPGESGTRDCLLHLKEQGYTLIATTPDHQATSITELEISGRVALLFGTELTGLTAEAMDMADKKVFLPMKGFTESLNLSVCAALFMQIITHKMELAGIPLGLPDREKKELKLEWYRKAVKRSSDILGEEADDNQAEE